MVARKFRLALATVALLDAGNSLAAASSVCVTCTDPEQVYSCSLAPGAGAISGRALHLRCLQEIAIQHGHAQCAVRNRGLGICNGRVYMVTAAVPPADQNPLQHVLPRTAVGAPISTQQGQLPTAAGQQPLPQTSPGVPASPTAASQERSPAPTKPPPKEPKTVVELAKRAAKETNDQIDRSARTVEKAAKSTWKCLTTFFSDC